MGITIYYSGKLRSMEELPSLIEEVTELCRRVGWENRIIHRSFEIPAHGIAFAPKGSQPVWMTFLDDGTLMNPDGYLTAKELELDIEKECRIETKTHYAGPKAHMMLIALIKYIGAKYFSTIGMYDESHFWETGNKAICIKEFEVMEQWVDQMICKLDELDGRIGDVGDSGERVSTKDESNLRMRDGPSLSSNIIGSVPDRSKVFIIEYADKIDIVNGQSGNWCKIRYDGQTGWVWGYYIRNEKNERTW